MSDPSPSAAPPSPTRGRGVAARLLDVATAAAATAAGGAIGVIVHESNAALIARYGRRGFRRVGSRRVTDHHAYPAGSELVALKLDAKLDGSAA